jgi:hypothetical protein
MRHANPRRIGGSLTETKAQNQVNPNDQDLLCGCFGVLGRAMTISSGGTSLRLQCEEDAEISLTFPRLEHT